METNGNPEARRQWLSLFRRIYKVPPILRNRKGMDLLWPGRLVVPGSWGILVSISMLPPLAIVEELSSTQNLLGRIFKE